MSHSEGAARLAQEAGQGDIQEEYVLFPIHERAGRERNIDVKATKRCSQMFILVLRNYVCTVCMFVMLVQPTTV